MIVTILLIELKNGVLKDPSKAGCNPSHSISSQLTRARMRVSGIIGFSRHTEFYDGSLGG
jgi:hypothetical protein